MPTHRYNNKLKYKTVLYRSREVDVGRARASGRLLKWSYTIPGPVSSFRSPRLTSIVREHPLEEQPKTKAYLETYSTEK